MSSPFCIDPTALRRGWGVKWGAVDQDVIPAWVADMDFPAPAVVRRAMVEAIERSDLGYPSWKGEDPLVSAFEERMTGRFGWSPAPGFTRVFSDLIQVLQVVIEMATEAGDGVALVVPSYPPFLASIERAGRRIVPIRVVDDCDQWRFDTEGLGDRLREAGTRLLVVVNPHNPTGRVLRRPELEVLAAVAEELDLAVLSDEIHADLVHAGHEHVPFASLTPDAASRTVTATSATKAFNIAGVRCALAHVGHAQVRTRLDEAPLDYFGQPGLLGRLATITAWTQADDWLDALREVLERNRRTIEGWVRSRDDVRSHTPEATYLAWLEFPTLAAAGADAADLLHEKGRVKLSGGPEFSQLTDVDTRSFARLNFATSPENLAEILGRISAVLDTYGTITDG